MTEPTIHPYNIIMPVNNTWYQLFAHPITNKYVIVDCGWFSLNHVLLLNKTLRSTMTTEEKAEEVESIIVSTTTLC